MRGARTPNFFAAIRVVLWQFLYYSREVGELSPEYSDCPAFCASDEGKPKGEFCDSCPRLELKNEFEANCIEFLDERVEGWKVWGFDELFAQMLDVFDFERLDYSKRTITADRLVSILDDEREKMRRIDEWNAKQK